MRFQVGDSASYTQTISEAHVALFIGAVGDTNPLHVDAEYAKKSRFGARIAQGILVAGLISTAIGTRLPGPGAIYLGQSLRFLKPTYLGDTITATVTVRAIRPDKPILSLETACTNQKGERVIEGEATVLYEEVL
ncbi:MaoC family dehydratase [Meiothermus ruber]|jgi:3-hydroxybutyryl-CoA dehydratase|uniref:MaoC domain protein dehydratase n=1 Tax=Meiothermus ruber (strain ATCC 35948 / DSM 1279 / VKM B-1258 / 21) TaxID=504728 RepID=D3PSK2_MEIRD|nr:MaoC family dehydratase [Meiothermus ruber]ADD28435.1 MaoC domain protein dehydratase [Meiothermus ruber DSM 1279]AGK06124.1 MaoC domain-containing protein dehydratase [Meiothermus ruber DSM 1279]MCL6528960.1 MaoC family dehydratase [Meiothermus ruber]MCX7801565.1 MaoC family dehydratase [Meiothermus ruber]GAO75392.1 MaoC domain-containing protein dehydratase [Meiothermus ruber H328]